MRFAKMHGAGNDFVIVNTFTENLPEDYNSLAQKVCDRNFGIGADGLMLVLPSEKNDIRMRIFNSDGSEPEMCGNGIRCFARFVYEQGIVRKTKMEVETLAGTIIPEIILEDGEIVGVKVDMGVPELAPEKIPTVFTGEPLISREVEIEGEIFKITAVSMGNPHCIIFVDDVEKTEINKWGPIIEKHPIFPKKTNVEFVQVADRETMIMRVWERGAGVTLACGTGACATLVAGVLNKKTGPKATVKLLGGDLVIEWPDQKNIFMTGPAELVFWGDINI